MDSDTSCCLQNNWSRELDTLFCGFFSCCANMFEEEDEQEPIKENYLTLRAPSYLIQPTTESKAPDNLNPILRIKI